VIRLPDPCLVVLVGASSAGKSTWAARWFESDAIVSSDRLRAVVGRGEHDQRASKDAFEVLDLIVDKRLRRGLTTVIDSTALEPERRASYLAAAARRGVPAFAVLFEADEQLCRARNRTRTVPVPPRVLASQVRAGAALAATIGDEGFTSVYSPDDVTLVPPPFLTALESARRQKEHAVSLEFGLQISRFTWPGGADEIGARLAAIAPAAEEAGFTSIWVMDHFLQIPGVGREWEEMLDSYTTLGYLAAVTSRARLGVLVTGITYRNLAHLGKIVATLDVLSGGRAMCGLGAAWFGREHHLYGWEFPPVRRRYELLEDALELLPLMWGPGSPAFHGRTIDVPEAICYPRPLQERVPILIGGSGERTTLRLVAQYADACNLFGEPDVVRRKIGVLQRHCADVDRDPEEITVTQLSSVGYGSTDELIGRYRELADAGVQHAIVSLSDLGDVAPIERFADVIAAFTA
jgi:F420-dependent oxidoreductase-like protein